MPHLHLSSLVTKKKNRDRRYIFSFYLALMHISLPRTLVIYNKMCTSRPRSCCRSTRSDGRRGRKDGRRGRKDRLSNRTPRDGSPNIHHLRPTIRRHQTKRRGAIYDARRPAGRNHRRTQHVPLRHANAKTGCGPTVPTEKLAFPCPGSRLCVSLHQANGKMPAAVP